EEEEEEEIDLQEPPEEGTEATASEGPKEVEPPVKKDDVNVCSIVADIFKETDTLKQACSTKYVNGREKFPNWKCVPTTSGDTTGGAICIPPRRRRLYIQKLHDWASDGNTQAVSGEGKVGTESQSSSSSSSSPPSDPRDVDLRNAFIQSAAIETFFAWHEYKMHKEIEKKEKEAAHGQIYESAGEDEANKNKDPQQLLQEKGEIPEEFKRQMFYTLGDYRDICVGDKTMIDTLSRASDDKDTMDKIEAKIEKILPKNGDKPAPKPSDEKRKTWWNENAKHIWNGMIYALTYNTNTASGTAPKQIDEVKTKLWDDSGNKPKPKTDGTHDYSYEKVELKEDQSRGPMSTAESPNSQPLTLKDFVVRPPYFRWLEEWGETFCRQRTRMLEQIKVECTEDGRPDGKKCSCYGEHCDDQLKDNPSIFPDLNCQDCAKY
ncbi:hypothetical protein PFTANZ_06198, partial [Plasmodium falciparum Tanzania (2000708)]